MPVVELNLSRLQKLVGNFKFDFSDAKIQKIIRPKTEDLFR